MSSLRPPAIETVELNLLLEWPQRRYDSRWLTIFGASLGLHALLFALMLQVPGLISAPEPERRVVLHHIPLYLPPDVLTQRAPNRSKPTKNIDLADLLAGRQLEARTPAPNPSTRHFEVPKTAPARLPKNTPQASPQAPQIALNEPQIQLPAGAPTGLTAPAPPPPAPTNQPFQNVGSEAETKSPHPTVKAPKASVQGAIQSLSQAPNSTHLIITDDNLSQPSPLSPGSTGQPGAASHAAVELQSDPQGADFRAYLAHILSIVRANWHRVTPESVRMGTLRGRTVIEFMISRDGSIPKLVVADPSGSDALDRASVAGLSMSNPLPPLPADFKGSLVRLAFTFSYNMPSQ